MNSSVRIQYKFMHCLHMPQKRLNIYDSSMSNNTLIDDKLSGSFRERHCDGSLISVSFHILDLSTASSTILGFTSAKLRVSLFYKEK